MWVGWGGEGYEVRQTIKSLTVKCLKEFGFGDFMVGVMEIQWGVLRWLDLYSDLHLFLSALLNSFLTDLPISRLALYNTASTSHERLFKFRCRLIKTTILNSVPQSYQPHFTCSIATCGYWLPCLTVLIKTIPWFHKLLLDSSALVLPIHLLHWNQTAFLRDKFVSLTLRP